MSPLQSSGVDSLSFDRIDDQEMGSTEKLTESSIWSDQAPLLVGNLEEQAEWCKTHPDALMDTDRMKASIDLVGYITTSFRRAGFPPMIMEGTLLGFMRQGSIIKGDNDLDFWIHRQLVSTPGQFRSFQKAMKQQGIDCRSEYQPYAAGWKIPCFPSDQPKTPYWKLDKSDSTGFYVDLSVFDEGDGGCLSPPCTWTQYLTLWQDGKTYPGFYGPFNWRLASWCNVSVWVPEKPEVTLAKQYTKTWKEPQSGLINGHKATWEFWMQNAPIPQEKKASYFHNRLEINAANILELQQRLETENAEQMEADARNQWAVAMEHCSIKPQANQQRLLDEGLGEVPLLHANAHFQESAEDVYKRTIL